MTDRLLDTTQAAKHWNVAAGTIRRWIRAGKLPAVKTPGGVWRVPDAPVTPSTSWRTSAQVDAGPQGSGRK